jgi:hypothetical protein
VTTSIHKILTEHLVGYLQSYEFRYFMTFTGENRSISADNAELSVEINDDDVTAPHAPRILQLDDTPSKFRRSLDETQTWARVPISIRNIHMVIAAIASHSRPGTFNWTGNTLDGELELLLWEDGSDEEIWELGPDRCKFFLHPAQARSLAGQEQALDAMLARVVEVSHQLNDPNVIAANGEDNIAAVRALLAANIHFVNDPKLEKVMAMAEFSNLLGMLKKNL